jgi:integrase
MYKTALERYFYYFITQNTEKDWFPDARKARGFANWINASDVTAGIYLENLYHALRYLFPERISELIALKDDAQTVKSMAKPSKDKSIFLLNPAEVFVKARNDFYQALSEPRTIHAMTRARNAAMVCFLCIQPLRAKNFVQLTEQDVEAAMKEFVKSDMKARRPHNVIIPDFLAEVLHSYSQLIKPFLGEVDQLWIANHGDAFKKKGASRAVRNYMKTLVGVAVSIHYFRDMFATYLSEQVDDPKQTKMISLALGHQSEGTTDQFYRNNAQMICDSISLQREIEIFLIAGNE